METEVVFRMHLLRDQTHLTCSSKEIRVGEHSNFKKIPTHTQDHGDDIATRGEIVRPRTLVDRKRKR